MEDPILKFVSKLEDVANKLKTNKPLTEGERNIAKNLILKHSSKIKTHSKNSSQQPKSTDEKAVKHAFKVRKYRFNRSLKDLMEGKD